MYKMNLLIFPNQLFEAKYFPPGIEIIYILEDPIYFGFRHIKMNFNKLKLILHRSSMKYYEDYIISLGIKVRYIEFEELIDMNYSFLSNIDYLCYFELNDHLLENRLSKHINYKNIKILNNPNFCIPLHILHKYHVMKIKKTPKFNHKRFYKFMKKYTGILDGVKSYDIDNRKKIKKNTVIPNIPDKILSKYEKDAILYIERMFPSNQGNTKLLFPIDHETSKEWLNYFLEHKFRKYGKYQDAMIDNNQYLFHSTISPMMNIGLLNPIYVINKATEFYQINKIDINNYEGFVRQILGWREYQRYTYIYAYNDLKHSNYFNHVNLLNNKWYTGKLGIKPVDDAIKHAFSTGYLNHINRLMVVSNFMNLCHINPHECYRWFMEYSVDSYDWVMIQNVYSMGQWSDGGLTMRKLYISSDNYIIKMSNYKKDEWSKIWNALYYYFISLHKDKMLKTIYTHSFNFWKKKTSKDKIGISNIATTIIKKLTKK